MSRPHRTVLPHCLALIYALAIAYASLQPFGPWLAPPPGTPFFLFAPTVPRFTRFDVIANVVAYLPLGFFVALMPRRYGPWGRFGTAIAAGAAVSFVLETLQMLLPLRAATVVDLASNAAGAALGGAFGVMFAYSPRAKRAVARVRHELFLGGKSGDVGLTLVLVWLVVQVNPGIPLFATIFDPAVEWPTLPGVNGSAMSVDIAALLVEAAHSAFQLLGVGLFLALLLRERRYIMGGVLLLLVCAVLMKTVAAALLLNPVALQTWLRPGVSAGVVAGTLLLVLAMWLPRPAQVAIATVALLSSLLATVLAPELIFTRAPLAMFNWSYGHLLNFNGLTHAVLLLWPVVASAFLFTLAGRPRWGEPG